MATISEELKIILSAQNNTMAAFAGMNKSLSDLKDAAIKVGSAIAAGLAIKDTIDTMEQWATSVRKVEAVTGLTAEQASRLGYAAKLSNLDINQFALDMDRLAKNMFAAATNSGRGGTSFKEFGISVKDAHGNIKNINDLFLEVSDRVRKLGDGAASTALEMAVFGRSGADLHEMLMQGADGLKQFMQQSDLTGNTLNQSTLQAMIKLREETTNFEGALQGLKLTLGTAVLPIISGIVLALTRFVEWIRSAAIESQFFAGIVKAVSEAIQRLWGFFKGIIDAVERFTRAIGRDGLTKALQDLAGDVGKAVYKLLSDIGDKLDSLGPLGTVAKDVLIAIGGALVLAALAGVVTKVVAIGLALASLPILTTISVILVAVAVEETVRTIQTVTDNWDTWVAAVHQGLLQNKNDGNDFGRTFIRGLVGWGDDFSALGTKVHDAFLAVANAVKKLWADLTFSVETEIQNLVVLIDQLILKINEIAGTHIPTIPGVPPPPGAEPPPKKGSGAGAQPPKMPTCDPGYTPVKWADGSWTCEPIVRGGHPTPYAAGGIVTRPTLALIGESGPEAVIPLGRGGAPGDIHIGPIYVSGNITESEDALAERIAEKIGDLTIRAAQGYRHLGF